MIPVMIKRILVQWWEENVCEGVNRKAERAFMRASHLWKTQNKVLRFFAMKMFEHNTKKYACEIYPQAKIGPGLRISHCVGIVVGSTAVIGENCTIFPNVVIGARYSSKEKSMSGQRHATIGNNCILGANSSIIGKITIGNNVTIGAGAVVTKDIPDNAVVVGHNHIVSGKENS